METKNEAQKLSLKAKEWIASIKKDTLPEYKGKFQELNPAYGQLEIIVDFSSFGSDDSELSYVMNQINNIYEGVKYLQGRSAVAKEELESQLKKVNIKMNKDESKRCAMFAGNELTVVSHSFYYRYLTSTEITDAFENGL